MESHFRTALKTLSWRIVAAFITGSLAWAATGSLEAGVAMGTADTLVKLVLYYLHERAWARVRVGYQSEALEASPSPASETVRSELAGESV